MYGISCACVVLPSAVDVLTQLCEGLHRLGDARKIAFLGRRLRRVLAGTAIISKNSET